MITVLESGARPGGASPKQVHGAGCQPRLCRLAPCTGVAAEAWGAVSADPRHWLGAEGEESREPLGNWHLQTFVPRRQKHLHLQGSVAVLVPSVEKASGVFCTAGHWDSGHSGRAASGSPSLFPGISVCLSFTRLWSLTCSPFPWKGTPFWLGRPP